MGKPSLLALVGGLLISTALTLLYAGCISEPTLKVIQIPQTWNGTAHVWLEAWMQVGSKEYPHIQSVSPHNQSRIREALRPGDRVEISCRRVSAIFASDNAAIITYKLEGPSGSRTFVSASDAFQLAGWIATVLIPTLTCVLIAVELEVRRRHPPE